jgi:hypothetical protein
VPNHPKPSAKNEAGEPSESERFTSFVRGIVNVPGAEVKQQIERERQERKRKRTSKNASGPASTDRD